MMLDDIWVDTFGHKIELMIIPDKWVDDSKNGLKHENYEETEA